MLGFVLTSVNKNLWSCQASLEMSLFFRFVVVLGVSAGAKPCAAVCAARLGRSVGGHPKECGLLRSIQPLQLHSLLIALPPGMFRRGLTPYLLGWLAARLPRRGCDYWRSHCQIFVLHSFPAVAHLHPAILPLTHQRFGLRRPIAFILRLELQIMPPVLHHPIVADPSFRL